MLGEGQFRVLLIINAMDNDGDDDDESMVPGLGGQKRQYRILIDNKNFLFEVRVKSVGNH